MKNFIKRTFLFLLSFCVFVIIINTDLFDENLSPQALDLLKQKDFPPVEDNAFFAFIGIQSSKEKNTIEAGHEIVQKNLDNKLNNLKELKESEILNILGVTAETKFSVNNTLFFSCFSDDSNFDCLNTNREEAEQSLFQNNINSNNIQLMIKRYQKIIQMKLYSSYFNDGFNMHLPNYSIISRLGTLYLINGYNTLTTDQFLTELTKSFKFWKMVLSQGNYLIDKVIALNNLKTHILIISEFIRLNDLNEVQAKKLEEILLNLSKEELDLSEAFINEAKLVSQANMNLNENLTLWDEIFYQPNATINHYIDSNLNKQMQLAQLPLNEFYIMRLEPKESQRFKFRPHHLYNFIGKVLNHYSSGAWDGYIARVYDTDNMIKLVHIQLQIKLKRDKSIDKIIKHKNNFNPYNNKPYNYDNKTRVLSFKCLNSFEQCEIKI